MRRFKEDLAGKVFNKLIVIEASEITNKKREIYWKCLCECEKESNSPNYRFVTTNNLKSGKVKSCGCLWIEKTVKEPNLKLIGQKFGKLTVLAFSRKDRGHRLWFCKCSCEQNEIKEYFENNLKNKSTVSCGCHSREQLSKRRKIDITGKKFGRLTALKRLNDTGISFWLCECECKSKDKNTRTVQHSYLTGGSVKSCGCLRGEDLTGREFGYLTVIEKIESKGKSSTYWLCKCSCSDATEKLITYSALVNGQTESCGCRKREGWDYYMLGRKFGRLTVLERGITDWNGSRWICECECGSKPDKSYHLQPLTQGSTQSCGCYQKQRASETHFKGTSKLTEFLRAKLDNWKFKTANSCSFRCVITGGRFDEIHHLYPFSKIVEELVHSLGITSFGDMGEYSQELITRIVGEFHELHEKYGLGVCLSEEMHIKFHRIYGKYEATPNNFYKFYKDITGKDFIVNIDT